MCMNGNKYFVFLSCNKNGESISQVANSSRGLYSEDIIRVPVRVHYIGNFNRYQNVFEYESIKD